MRHFGVKYPHLTFIKTTNLLLSFKNNERLMTIENCQICMKVNNGHLNMSCSNLSITYDY